ncbi:hypothetical protein CSUI_011085, partial [Cystoisospora suis]
SGPGSVLGDRVTEELITASECDRRHHRKGETKERLVATASGSPECLGAAGAHLSKPAGDGTSRREERREREPTGVEGSKPEGHRSGGPKSKRPSRAESTGASGSSCDSVRTGGRSRRASVEGATVTFNDGVAEPQSASGMDSSGAIPSSGVACGAGGGGSSRSLRGLAPPISCIVCGLTDGFLKRCAARDCCRSFFHPYCAWLNAFRVSTAFAPSFPRAARSVAVPKDSGVSKLEDKKVRKPTASRGRSPPTKRRSLGVPSRQLQKRAQSDERCEGAPGGHRGEGDVCHETDWWLDSSEEEAEEAVWSWRGDTAAASSHPVGTVSCAGTNESLAVLPASASSVPGPGAVKRTGKTGGEDELPEGHLSVSSGREPKSGTGGGDTTTFSLPSSADAFSGYFQFRATPGEGRADGHAKDRKRKTALRSRWGPIWAEPVMKRLVVRVWCPAHSGHSEGLGKRSRDQAEQLRYRLLRVSLSQSSEPLPYIS